MAKFLHRNRLAGAAVIILLLLTAFITISSFRTHYTEKSIHINEVMSCNLSALSDNSGAHPDWLELYNSSSEKVSLKGFSLSTGERGSRKYIFPDLALEPGQFLIVYASDKYISDALSADLDREFSIEEYVMTGRGAGEKGPEEDKISEGAAHVPFSLPSEGVRLLLRGRTGTLLEDITVPELKYDVSYGRITDGTGDFETLTPSPGEGNAFSRKVIMPGKPTVALSRESGFYETGFQLELKDDSAAEILYTTDCSDPIEHGIPYAGPITIADISDEQDRYADKKEISCFFMDPTSVQIDKEEVYKLPTHPVDKASVIRAVSRKADGSYSGVVTGVYFVGYEGREEYINKPVMSIVADPDELFGYERGIYVTGKAMDDYLIRENEDNVTPWSDANYRNRGIEWEREAVVTFFDADRRLKASQSAGIRIKGNWSRAYPQKSLNIYARKEYGSEYFDTVFFDGDLNESAVTMYNGGNDCLYKLEDTLAADMARGLDFSVMRHYPCYLFLNGEYWGIMDISEKFDEAYLKRHYGVDENNVVIIKNLEPETHGDRDAALYEELRYLVYTGEFDKEENYAKFLETVDIDSMLDYYAFRIYIGNHDDWPARNFALWRTVDREEGEYGDCRWRFMLFDVNNTCMELKDLDMDFVSYVRQGDNMFDELMKNKDFERAFYERLKLLSEKNCSPENAKTLLENRRKSMHSPMEGWYGRFADDPSLVDMFDNRVDEMIRFFSKRPEI